MCNMRLRRNIIVKSYEQMVWSLHVNASHCMCCAFAYVKMTRKPMEKKKNWLLNSVFFVTLNCQLAHFRLFSLCQAEMTYCLFPFRMCQRCVPIAGSLTGNIYRLLLAHERPKRPTDRRNDFFSLCFCWSNKILFHEICFHTIARTLRTRRYVSVVFRPAMTVYVHCTRCQRTCWMNTNKQKHWFINKNSFSLFRLRLSAYMLSPMWHIYYLLQRMGEYTIVNLDNFDIAFACVDD